MGQNRIVYFPANSGGKNRKYAKKIFFAAGAAVAAAALGFAILYAVRLPELRLKNIKISGAETVSGEEIKEEALREIYGNRLFFIPENSFFGADAEKISGRLLEKFPRLNAVSVRKKFPDTVEISLKERKMWAVFCLKQNCAYLDKTGFAYEEAPLSSGYLVLKITSDAEKLDLPSQALKPELAEKIGNYAEELKQKTELTAVGAEFSSKTPRELKIKTGDGFKIHISRNDDFSKTLGILKILLEQEIKNRKSELEYVDLRFGNKTFYKFRD